MYIFAEKGIVNKIKTRRDTVLSKSVVRDKVILEQLANNSNLEDLDKLTKEERITNQEKWKKRVGYSKRWIIEIAYSTFKRIFSDHVRAKNGKILLKNYTKRLQHTII